MKLPFKPHIFALVGSAVILAASGMLFVKSQSTEAASSPPAPVAQPATPAPVAAPAAPVAGATAPLTNAPTFTTAQIDQWVAPVALFPDPLLSQVLMASTYPANVVQAVQWSHDNPKLQGDAAVQAVSNQPWDPSVKSLVAFPQLTALMGENPQWVQNLGDAFLAQPKDVMDSVQKLRLMAEQTGTLKTTPQQTVTTTPVTVNQNTTVQEPSTTSAAPAQVIKIEPTNPEVVYVPTYNPTTAYGTWPNTAYPPVYLPPPEDQFGDNFVDGLGFGLGIVTTAALFGSIDWDDDDYDGYHGGGGGYNRNGDNNINIDVDRYNRVSGQQLAKGSNVRFQHNPAYRDGVGYQSNAVSQRYNRTNTAGGLSATPNAATVNRDAQRQAARTQMQQTQRKDAGTAAQRTTRDTQRQASSQQVNKIAQRNNYRGYDSPNTDARRNAAKTQANRSTNQQTQRRQEAARTQTRETQNRATTNTRPRQQQTRSALSGNDSRSPSWQAQNQRGQQSLNRSSANREQRSPSRERSSGHREVNRR
ncbi:DUF3300 domain-containing protein [Buttiauxella sp. 3AFRM03]|uniref:DUF3300 domain-containing protein n=1 Tax=Buttiauxella sp. 3AFRM03 TaxID=2479367 RepID=UPI000EF79593|nr:DUF3300 domain-containing protein [Buttiauxella sp. 3AFRM03]AYN27526.1 DUF3300 domain-containing protein [Buttiauxella sp. 3AFRM03]